MLNQLGILSNKSFDIGWREQFFDRGCHKYGRLVTLVLE